MCAPSSVILQPFLHPPLTLLLSREGVGGTRTHHNVDKWVMYRVVQKAMIALLKLYANVNASVRHGIKFYFQSDTLQILYRKNAC